ncbi:MAG: MFS transporter, partial [Pseudomonadales bacterium]|nr:MFS transporter [Pseudomonadales bacterium]
MKNFFYPLGFFGISFISTVYTQWIVYFYSQQDFGSSPWPTVGTVLFIGFIVQGLWSPIIGHWSDHAKHLLGSKKSIVLIASISMSSIFFFLWRQEEHLTLIAMMLIYNILFVSIMQPLLAMLPTIETNPDKRVKLTLVGAVLAIAATIGALVIGAQIKSTYGYNGLGTSGFAVLLFSIVIPMMIAKVPQQSSTTQDQNFISHFFKQSLSLLKTRDVSAYIAGNGLTLGICMTLTILIPFIAEDRFSHQPN